MSGDEHVVIHTCIIQISLMWWYRKHNYAESFNLWNVSLSFHFLCIFELLVVFLIAMYSMTSLSFGELIRQMSVPYFLDTYQIISLARMPREQFNKLWPVWQSPLIKQLFSFGFKASASLSISTQNGIQIVWKMLLWFVSISNGISKCLHLLCWKWIRSMG